MARTGYSEPLVRKLQIEEAKLLDLRQALANATASERPHKVARTISVAPVLEAFEEVARNAKTRADRARVGLADLLESVVVTPIGDDGHNIRLKLRKETAAIAGGHLCEEGGCGGRI